MTSDPLAQRNPRTEAFGRGARILVAGPDGSGKSTVARQLATTANDAGYRVIHTHFLPRATPRADAGQPAPHGRAAHPVALAIPRVAVRYVEFLLGFMSVWRRRKRTVTIVERGWVDQLVDPTRYRLPAGLETLIARLSGALPKFDVVIICGGDATEIASRKRELTVEETKRQLLVWGQLSARAARRACWVDTTSADEQASCPGDLFNARPVCRWRRIVGTPRRFSMRACGRGQSVGKAFELYQPLSRSGRLRKALARPLLVAGIGRGARFPEWDDLVSGHPAIPTTGLVALASNGQCAHVVRSEDRIFKLSAYEDAQLLNEIDILRSLPERIGPAIPPFVRNTYVVPGRVRALEMSLFPGRPSSGLVANRAALDVAIALAQLGITHGDFVPWNLLQAGGQYCLIDWQRATHEFLPAWDLLVWHVQSATHLSGLSANEVAQALMGESGWLTTYCQTLGFECDDHLDALVARIAEWHEVPESSRTFAQMTLDNIAGQHV